MNLKFEIYKWQIYKLQIFQTASSNGIKKIQKNMIMLQ